MNKGLWRLGYGVILVVVIWLATAAIVVRDYELEISKINRDNDQLTRSLEEHVRSSLHAADAKLLLMKSEYERAGVTQAVGTVMQSVRPNPLLLQSLILDAQGRIVRSTYPGAPDTNYADRAYFQFHRQNDKGQLYVSQPRQGRITGKMSIYLSRRLNAPDGEFAGIVVLAVNPEYFSSFYRSMDLQQGRLVRVVGEDGIVRASWNHRMDEMGQDIAGGALFQALGQKRIGAYQSPGIHYRVDRFFSYRAMSDFPLIVQVGYETDFALAEYRQRRNASWWIALFGTLVVAFFILVEFRRQAAKQQAETALRQKERLNRTILQTTDDGYWVVDAGGLMVDVNEAYCRMSGYSHEEFLGLHIQDVDADEPSAETTARIERIIQNGSERFEVRHRRKNGSVFDVEITATLLPGESPLMVCFCRDISERRRNLLELQTAKKLAEESEARFKALHDASFGGIMIHDQGIILDVNQGMTEMSGYSVAELIGMDGLQLVAPGSRVLVTTHMLCGFEKPYAAVGLRKNGAEYPLRIAGRKIIYQGKPVRVVEFRDITEQVEAERLIRESQNRLQTVLDSIDALVYIADMETNELLFINEYGIRHWGKPAPGQKCWELLQALSGPCPFCNNDKLVNADGKPAGVFRWEFQNRANLRWYEVADQAIRWNDGRLVRMEIATDISERKQAEMALQASEQRYRALMQQACEAVVIFDADTLEISEVNSAFETMTGFCFPFEKPLRVFDLFADEPVNIMRYLDEMYTNGVLLPALQKIRTRAGGVREVERTGNLIRIGERKYYLTAFRDVTEERRHQQEMHSDLILAAQVQRVLLPAIPRSAHFKISTVFEPQGFVSGDFYYLEWRETEQVLQGFLIDITGHGLATALQTAAVNVLLHQLADLPPDVSLSERLSWLNQRIPQYIDESTFAAAICFEFDFSLAQLRYASAGINHFLHNAEQVTVAGMYLGIREDETYELHRRPIRQGDAVCFLTDGIGDVFDRENNWGTIGADQVCRLFAEPDWVEKAKDDATAVCIDVHRVHGEDLIQ